MRIKKEYVLKRIGKELIVVPIKNEAIRFNGIITVNETGAFLFTLLQEEELSKNELVMKVLDKYEVDESLASNDIENFIKTCQEHKLFDE